MWPENLSLAGRGLCLRAAGKHVPAGRIRCQSAILSAGIAEAWNRIMQAGYDRYSGMAGSADCALRPEQGSLS